MSGDVRTEIKKKTPKRNDFEGTTCIALHSSDPEFTNSSLNIH